MDAKVLYGLLLDRMGLSVKNGWLDEKRRVYIIYTIADVMETLGCAEQKANKLLKELDTVKGIGLIERVRRGLGRPNVIYVKNFTSRDRTGPGTGQGEQSQNCENHKSGNVKTTKPDLRKPQTNETDINKTDFSNPYPSIRSFGGKRKEPGEMDGFTGRKEMDGMERLRLCRELIMDNIDFSILADENPCDRERLEGMVELMAEVCCTDRKTVRVNQGEIPAEAVKSRFLKLDSRHIRYVMDCMDKNTALVGNIRAYLLSALFNSPVTLSQYYASLVSHDMAEGLCRGG